MRKSVYIFGISGRMGQEVAKIVEQTSTLELVGGYSRSTKSEDLQTSPDIVIDFSLPETFNDLTKFIEKHGSCLVTGTTGLNDNQNIQLKNLAKSSAVFWSANMSFGVYLMCRLTETLAKYQQFYDYHVEETHHIHKKDKPSGTALIIEEAAKLSTTRLGETLSIREGEVFGVHRFIAKSPNESIEVRHEAFNRALFAQGAVDVSMWLYGKQPGFYTMDDFFQNFQN